MHAQRRWGIKLFAATVDHERGMVVDRAPLGLLIAALGAAVLAVSVFTPWYGVSITASGAAAARQELRFVAQAYGNTNFKTRANGIETQSNALARRQLTTVSAHQTLGHVSAFLLALAAIALLLALLRLVDRGELNATGGQIAFVGLVAAVVVAFRMVWPPGGAAKFVSLSLTWGIWLALLSAAAIVAGGAVAGRARIHRRPAPKRGPGAPPIGRDLTSARATSRVRP